MNTYLTTEQQDRLKAVSSKIHGDNRELLSDNFIEATTNNINEVLYELHNESPHAFVTVAHRDAKGKVIFTKLSPW